MLYSVIVVLLLSYDVSAKTHKIVGGKDTTITQYPYQAMLGTNQIFLPPKLFCGAVIYNAQYVVTAGHCCKAVAASMIRVVVGTSYSNTIGTERKASNVKVHPKYNVSSGVPDNDLCIIKLNKPLVFSDEIQPIGAIASEAEYVPGKKQTITGWGTTQEEGNVSKTLQTANILLDTEETCKEAYEDVLTENMVCASLNGTDSCQGDSGGPMVSAEKSPFTLTGIVSWGYGCARDGYPGVYTKVSKYTSWIEDNTRG